jgi:peroxiredoxin
MKYIYILCFVLTITACNRVKYVEFTGTMTGISSGAFVIKDKQGAIIMSETINDGTFHAKNVLPKAGYYDLFITGDLQKDYKKKLYDIYLEGGTYTISVNADSLDDYPVNKTDSKIQNQLSDFYIPTNQKLQAVNEKMQTITALLNDKNSPVAVSGNTDELNSELTGLEKQPDSIKAQALSDFVTRHPDNVVSAHILAQIDYKKAPADYYAAYQKFSAEQKATDDGKAEEDDLAQLAKLAPGAVAPSIIGKTLDGTIFNPKSLDKKIILVEFWRSDNDASRTNHHRLLTDHFSPLSNKKFTVVSVCLDTTQAAWAKAVKEDNIVWTQLSDLKGETSPNLTNWAVTAVPNYDLVDGDWHIIKRDVDFEAIPTEVATYLKMALTTNR